VKVREYLSASQWEFAEVVVVDDGSTDDTVQVARDAGVRVLQNPGNRGKGYSVKHGMLEAKGEWALFTDADLSTPSAKSRSSGAQWLTSQLRSPWIACGGPVSGGRAPALAARSGRPCFQRCHAPGHRNFHSRNTQCGFKLFQTSAGREVFSRQQLDGFGFDVEVLFIAKQLGFRSLGSPVRWDTWKAPRSACCSASRVPGLLKVRRNALQGKYK